MNAIKTPLPSRDMITQMQLSALLTATSTLGMLLATVRQDEATEGGKSDGGVRTAAENTLIGLCDRIDKMVAENDRWSFDAQNNLEASLTAMYAEHSVLIKRQIEVHDLALSPHARLKPKMMKLPDGMWLAIFGDVNDLQNALVGIGECPDLALKAFDALFKGQVPAHITEWISKREATDSQNKTYDQEQQSGSSENGESPLDGSGAIEPPADARPKNPPKRNRRKNRQEPGSGGPSTGPDDASGH